jgi:hypothetical protein
VLRSQGLWARWCEVPSSKLCSGLEDAYPKRVVSQAAVKMVHGSDFFTSSGSVEWLLWCTFGQGEERGNTRELQLSFTT